MKRSTRLIGLIAAVLLAAAPAAYAQSQAAAFDQPGPEITHGYAGDGCTFFRPVALKPNTPIILWGNGTNTRPVDYAGLLHHLASRGFVVAAANNPQAGSGVDFGRCLDFLTAENGREISPYHGKLDLAHVGAMGHSQGGSGAIMAGRDPRIIALAPIMPGGREPVTEAIKQAHGPILLLSGGLDRTAPPDVAQKPIFDAATQPVFWLTRADASHLIPMHEAGPYRAAITAWFLWRLKGDAAAGAMFTGPACGYCSDPLWTLQRKGTP